MNTFEDYISFWTICKVLINKRVQLSEKRHKKHQLHLLSPEICIGELKNSEKLLLAMMPPRNSWVNLSKSTRYRDIDGEHRQRMAAAKCFNIGHHQCQIPPATCAGHFPSMHIGHGRIAVDVVLV